MDGRIQSGGSPYAILFVTLPVMKYAKNSIVEQKSRTGKVNYKPFWEKFFVDVILVVL